MILLSVKSLHASNWIDHKRPNDFLPKNQYLNHIFIKFVIHSNLIHKGDKFQFILSSLTITRFMVLYYSNTFIILIILFFQGPIPDQELHICIAKQLTLSSYIRRNSKCHLYTAFIILSSVIIILVSSLISSNSKFKGCHLS